MTDPPHVTALVPAAGHGVRMGSNIPKQFLTLGLAPLIIHTLRTMEATPGIRDIIVMIPQNSEPKGLEVLVNTYELTKVTNIIEGGNTRQDSVSLGLQAASLDTDIIVIHDGVRPFATPEMFEHCIRAAQDVEGAIIATKIQDTVKRVSQEGTIKETVDRTSLWAAQTPQVFQYRALQEALRCAYTDGVQMTDEAGLLERLGYTIKVVEGTSHNLKITTPKDLALAELLLQSTAASRPAH